MASNIGKRISDAISAAKERYSDLSIRILIDHKIDRANERYLIKEIFDETDRIVHVYSGNHIYKFVLDESARALVSFSKINKDDYLASGAGRRINRLVQDIVNAERGSRSRA